jgi:hypothetical protein
MSLQPQATPPAIPSPFLLSVCDVHKYMKVHLGPHMALAGLMTNN